MSERNASPHPGTGAREDLRSDEGGLRAPPELSRIGKAWWWFHFLILVKLARLRFIAVLAIIGLAIARWDLLSAWYEKWTRPLLDPETAVRSDTEYWCPMHPNVIRDHSGKCPICAMPLSRRKKGDKAEDEALPPGVVSRVQLTPYKVAVAGIETTSVSYQSLTRDIHAVGFVEFDERRLARIAVRATGKSRIEKLFANVTGQVVEKGEPLAELYNPDLVVTVQNLLDARQEGNGSLERMARDRLRLWSIDDEQINNILRTGKPITRVTLRSPIRGYVIKKYQVEGEYVEEGARLYDVADLSSVWIEAQVYEDDLAFLDEGQAVTATARAFPNREFKGKLAFINPHLDAATRTLKVRFDMDNARHDLRPGMYATVSLRIPIASRNLLAANVDPEQQDASREGRMLTVPERAVIDTGSRKFVYRQAEPDVFEGVEVRLGPRCGDVYPVLHGLHEGEQVVTTGSFLIDAETRLSGGASAMYFGASGGPQGSQHSATNTVRPSLIRDEDATVEAVLARMSPEDRRLAREQGPCPVLGTRLGVMGLPVSVVLEGRKVLLCCKGCVKRAKGSPKATLTRLADAKSKGRQNGSASTVAGKPGGREPSDEAEIRANLAKLKADDLRIVQQQKYCAVHTEVQLGEMGVPFAVEIHGHKVFLCCKGCKMAALQHPEQTLAQVEKLKTRTEPSR